MAEVLCVAVSTISRVVVSGSRDCRFQLLDLDGGDLIHSEKLEGPVTSLSLNNCGTLLAIGTWNPSPTITTIRTHVKKTSRLINR